MVTGTAYLFLNAFSFCIVIISTILKYSFLYVAEEYGGLTTRSKQTKYIIRPIFLLSFISYAIVPIVSTWDSRGSLVPMEIENFLTVGAYSDFNSTWFLDVGRLVTETMTFNIAMPIIDFMVGWFKRYLLRAWDQKKIIPGEYIQPQSTSIQTFVELYSGDEFKIHIKYAYILTVCFTAFFYAPGIPYLFLIAAASLCCLYFVEKMAMAYGYKKPPMYDNEHNILVLRMLAFAPVLYAMNALWVFSNQ